MSITTTEKRCMAMKKMEGTYRLEWRKLPDGRIVKPPEVSGLLSFTKKYRNFNVMWKDPSGEVVSISSASEYNLDEKGYTETNIYYMTNDPSTGKGPEYDLSHAKGKSKVRGDERHIELKLPLHDEPDVMIEGDELVATRKGDFEDHWKKVA